MILLVIWLVVIPAISAFGYAWHAGRPKKPANVFSLADAKARREQAQRVDKGDRKSIHFGATS